MYTPTNEELEEIGFKQPRDFAVYKEIVLGMRETLRYCEANRYKPVNVFYITHDNDEYIISIQCYPQSKEDILTLIRLFSNS